MIPEPRRRGSIVLTEPTYVYVMVHRRLRAAKVGKGMARAGRISGHLAKGWDVYRAVLMPDHASASAIESRVKSQLESEGLARFLPQAQMPQGGYTETVSLAQKSAAELWRVVLEAEAATVVTWDPDDVESGYVEDLTPVVLMLAWNGRERLLLLANGLPDGKHEGRLEWSVARELAARPGWMVWAAMTTVEYGGDPYVDVDHWYRATHGVLDLEPYMDPDMIGEYGISPYWVDPSMGKGQEIMRRVIETIGLDAVRVQAGVPGSTVQWERVEAWRLHAQRD
ncbi:hypothetical protein [Streptomyces hirsutus]|uniref:hypothetical protein n=1 Tax=Streptomyces hirsutus TaxID=35620 RepID=UPI003325F545